MEVKPAQSEDATKLTDKKLDDGAAAIAQSADGPEAVAAKKRKKNKSKKKKAPLFDLQASDFVPTVEFSIDPVSEPVVKAPAASKPKVKFEETKVEKTVELPAQTQPSEVKKKKHKKPKSKVDGTDV